MEIQEVYKFAGDPATKQIDEVISVVADKSPEEILETVDCYGIEWYISGGGTLFIRDWQVAGEEFVSPGKVAEIRVDQPEPQQMDDLYWLSANLEELRRLYAGQWIAIKEGQVVASSPTLRGLVEATEAAGVESPFVTSINEGDVIRGMAYAHQGL